MDPSRISCLTLSTVLLLCVMQVSSQDSPTISVSNTATTLKTDETFTFNCTVTPYNAAWTTEVVKTKFEVNTPKGDKVTASGSGWPMSIAQGGNLDSTLRAQAGSRYSAMPMGGEVDNMTKTFVMISATKPEDSGTWTCRVLKAGQVIANATEMINLQVDGPVSSVRIYVEAMPGGTVLANQTLSSGAAFTFMDGMETRLTCDAAIPGSTALNMAITVKDSDAKTKSLDSSFTDTVETTSASAPMAGGRVAPMVFVAKTNGSFKPQIKLHGVMLTCEATVQGYPSVNASFTFNVESKPQFHCADKAAYLDGHKDATLECTVLANPPVTMATWDIPNDHEHQLSNVSTVTNTLTGISLKTVLHIPTMLTKYYGKYNISATNSHGTETHVIHLSDSIVSAAAMPSMSVAIATSFSLVLAMLLSHR